MNILNLSQKIIGTLDKKKKNWFIKTVLLMLLTSISEFFTISLVTPFLYIISNPNFINENKSILLISNLLNLNDIFKLQILAGTLFLFVVVVSSFIKILNFRNYSYFSQNIGAQLSNMAFANILNQNYTYHIYKNSSETITAISNYTDKAVIFINSLLNIITALFSSFAIIVALLYLNFEFTSITIVFFTFSYLLLLKFTKNKLQLNSTVVASVVNKQVKIIQETTASIRDILIGRDQNYFINLFSVNEKERRYRLGQSQFLGGFPKYVLEALGISLIIIISLISFTRNVSNDINNTVPLVGAIALGCQRLLPILQLAYASLTNLRQDQVSVERLMKIVNLKNKNLNLSKNYILFKENITFQNVDFSYPNKKNFVIKDFNFKINKGDSIAVVGETGSGKSTLINILLGLIQPTKGKIFVDGNLINSGHNPKKIINISHVPQTINLSDLSIKQNIAYGIPEGEINLERVKECAKLAAIDDFINKLNYKYNHIIGEKGIKISGGQRQRIGIARALYKDASIIILDEATSALDKRTEELVLQSLKSYKKDLTIILITHKLSTIKFFDNVFEIKDGCLIVGK